MLRAGLLTLSLVVATATAAYAEPVTGFVLDGNTLKPIAGARIYTGPASGAPATITTSDGFYRLEVPAGTIELTITARGYEQYPETLEVPKGGVRDHAIFLIAAGSAGETIEVVVEAPIPPPPGRQDLGREVITRIPGTRGDALQAIRSLPGVANANGNGPGAGDIVIRGAAPEDSKIMVDGIEVPLLYHFGGLQSFIPSEFIDNIEFVPGGFGVEEGRSTGGVVNVVTRTDPVPKPEGFVEFSFINLAGMFQTPLNSKKTLFLSGAVRRSAIDFILPVAAPDLKFVTAPQYYDAQLRLVYKPNQRHRFAAFGFVSYDLFALINDDVNPNEPDFTGKLDLLTQFTRLITSWTYVNGDIDNRLTLAGGTSGFNVSIGVANDLDTYVNQLEFRDDFGWRISPRLKLRAGIASRYDSRGIDVSFPAPPGEGELPPGTFSDAPRLEYASDFTYHVSGAYVAADIKPGDKTTITPGLRLDHFYRLDDSTWMPRVLMSHKFSKDWTGRLAVGSYSRGLDQAESEAKNVEPELATQYVAMGEYQLRSEVKATLSTFYTDKRRLVVRDPLLAQIDPRNAYTNRGRGRSFGAELLVRGQFERFFGWVAYTISRSDRFDDPLDERRLFDYDQTHNFIAVGSYRWKKWELGGRLQYSTGEPETPIVGSRYLADINAYVPIYGEFLSVREEAAHQLDVRVDRHWTFNKWKLSAFLDVTNVYAHPRVRGYRYNFDYTEREAITDLPVLPAFGVRGSF